MRGAFLYIDAGKGHYIPAKALSDGMVRLGHEAIMQDLFMTANARFWRWFAKQLWRFMLHHPNYERKTSSKNDDPGKWLVFLPLALKLYAKRFTRWLDANKPDFLICTNFLGGLLLPALMEASGRSIPVYYYSADIFMSPKLGLNNKLDKLYIASQEGVDWVIAHGQLPERTSLCPFPLQHKFSEQKRMTRQEARAKLGLKNKFTVLYSLGGEGIGSMDFVEAAVKRNLDIQVVLVGKMSKTTTMKHDLFKLIHPDFTLAAVGFVDNINEYFYACDIVVGKQGANTLMESIYLQRPCLISEILYTADCSARYLKDKGIGWSETNPETQVEIVKQCVENPDFERTMDERFRSLPLRFGADAFAELLIKDTLDLQQAASGT
jgi:processive 1,2-diacylglycerol beta-glucosyltransferase